MSSNKAPMVSVWITAYNHEAYIGKALDSVLMQITDFDFEIVVGEDCSTDGTRDVLLAYQKKYPKKIKLLLHEKNLGFMQNTVETWNACSGKYVALLDSDDYWQDPYKLQKQVDFLEAHSEYSLCYHDAVFIDQDDSILDDIFGCYKEYSADELVCGMSHMHTSSVMQKNVSLNNVHIFEDSYQPDTVLNYYAGLYGKAGYLTDIKPSSYRQHSTGMWSSADLRKKLQGSIQTKYMIIDILDDDERRINIVEGYIEDTYLNYLVVAGRDKSYGTYMQVWKEIVSDEKISTVSIGQLHIKDVVQKGYKKIKNMLQVESSDAKNTPSKKENLFTKFKNSKLLQNTFIYTLLQIINSGIPFLLLPILTRYLSPEDYGMISTYNAVFGVVSIFVGLSVAGGVGVSFFHLSSEKLKQYIGNAFNLLLMSSSIVFIVIMLLEPYLVEKFKLPAIWFYIAVLMAWMQMIIAVNLSLWRAQQKAKPFALYEISQTLFNVGLSLFLIVTLHYGWEGRVIGLSSTIILFGLLSVLFIFKRGYAVLNISKETMRDILHFGIPLIPHQAALWVRFSVDILLITAIVGISQTGLYAIGLQFGMVIGVLSTAFNNAYMPHLYEKLKNDEDEEKRSIVKFTYSYFAFMFVFAMMLSGFFVWLIPFYLGDKFQGAAQYIFWLSLAYSFQAMYLMVVNYIFYVQKTYLLSMVTVSTSIFHIVLSYILISNYGAIGAAYASVVSFFLTFVLVWRVSSQLLKMPWALWQKIV